MLHLSYSCYSNLFHFQYLSRTIYTRVLNYGDSQGYFNRIVYYGNQSKLFVSGLVSLHCSSSS